jgi:hypothetical protein
MAGPSWGGSTLKRSVSVSLGAFACDALAGEEKNSGPPVSAGVARAIRCYLNDKDSNDPGWSFPPFLRNREPSQEVELELSIDDSLWGSLEEEAQNQRVSVRQMLEHAVLYFAAEVNAGRATQRILGDLEEEN